MRQVPAHSVVGTFADHLLGTDLPDLPVEHRRAVVAFVAHRVDTLPSFTRFGVLVIGSVFRVVMMLPGGAALAGLLMKLPIPFVGEYPRLIRSLGFAYVWEHWPDTSASGAQIEAAR